jgi:hypothetical protein
LFTAASATTFTILLAQPWLIRPSFALPSDRESILSARDEEQPLEWTVVGDSWTTGVTYNQDNRWDGALDPREPNCLRTKEAWGAQMAADKSWQAGGDASKFNFAACGGSVMKDTERQLRDRGGAHPTIIWSMTGGNNAFFGEVARACIFVPMDSFTHIVRGYGPEWADDTEGKGECKQSIQKAQGYIEDQFADEFKDTIDHLLKLYDEKKAPNRGLDLYFSSYVQFFNAETDACDNWSFGHSTLSKSYPRLVKGLRKVINDAVARVNELQAEVISKYEISDGSRHIRHETSNKLYENHRFCEPAHTKIEDQYYHDDVWIWNLQYKDTQADAGGKEVPVLESGVWHMSAEPGFVELPANGTQLNGTTPVTVLPSQDELAALGSSGAGAGWMSRPVHPKFRGHEAMKGHFIERMRNDKIPGVLLGATEPNVGNGGPKKPDNGNGVDQKPPVTGQDPPRPSRPAGPGIPERPPKQVI